MALLGALLAGPGPLHGQPADAGTAAATADGGTASASAAAPTQTRAEQVRALMDGSLDPNVEPASLFRIDLTQPNERLLELARGERVRREPRIEGDEDTDALLAFFALPAKKRQALLSAHQGRQLALRQSLEQQAHAAQQETQRQALARQLAALLNGTLDPKQDAAPLLSASLLLLRSSHEADQPLDPAGTQLQLLQRKLVALSLSQRAKLLEAHLERRTQLDGVASGATPGEADSVADLAGHARRRALQEAQGAKSEAQRLLAARRARLLGVLEAHAHTSEELAGQRADLEQQREAALEWRRKITELGERSVLDGPREPQADRWYPQLGSDLARLREELRKLLGEAMTGASLVSEPELDGELPAGVPTDALQGLQQRVRDSFERLRTGEQELRWARGRALREDMSLLNGSRLELLELVSPVLRDALLGFRGRGMGQFADEIDQIVLEFQVRLVNLPYRLTLLRQDYGDSPVPIALALFKLLLATFLFRLWRGRAKDVLGAMRRKAMQTSPSTGASRLVAAGTWYLLRVRRPIELLIYLEFVLEVLDHDFQLFLVDYVGLLVRWALIGSTVVLALDAVAARQQLRLHGRDRSVLRLRSLRLVGLFVVGTGFVLSLVELAVGEGTVHSWVSTGFVLVCLPVAVVLVRWWRPTILTAIDQRPRQTSFTRWVQSRRSGLWSYPACGAAGVVLVMAGVLRWLMGHAARLETTRRVLAYLFRTEVSRHAEAQMGVSRGEPIDDKTAAALHPENMRSAMLEHVAEEPLKAIEATLGTEGSTLSVVVGPRGAGKSQLLRRLAEPRGARALYVECPPDGIEGLKRELRSALSLGPRADDDSMVEALRERDLELVCIDDIQRIVRPAIGGLKDLDWLADLPRRAETSTAWVLSVGSQSWSFIHRARSENIAFDLVLPLPSWSEEDIGALMRLACANAGIQPVFEGLVVPRQLDEPSEVEGDRAEVGFYRILWDYSGGNPAIALHWWRHSLFMDAEAATPTVRLFDAPDTRALETAPMNVRFLLRAVLQLDVAAPRDLATSLDLPPSAVEEAVRFAVRRGYLERRGARVRITWQWYRAIQVALKRQHLTSE